MDAGKSFLNFLIYVSVGVDKEPSSCPDHLIKMTSVVHMLKAKLSQGTKLLIKVGIGLLASLIHVAHLGMSTSREAECVMLWLLWQQG